jgi:hypothetical protein
LFRLVLDLKQAELKPQHIELRGGDMLGQLVLALLEANELLDGRSGSSGECALGRPVARLRWPAAHARQPGGLG